MVNNDTNGEDVVNVLKFTFYGDKWRFPITAMLFEESESVIEFITIRDYVSVRRMSTSITILERRLSQRCLPLCRLITCKRHDHYWTRSPAGLVNRQFKKNKFRCIGQIQLSRERNRGTTIQELLLMYQNPQQPERLVPPLNTFPVLKEMIKI